MKKNNAFRRAAALMAALSITVSLAAPAFAETYYIDDGDITITKDTDGKQTVQQNGTTKDDSGEIIITTREQTISTQESDLEGPAAEDSGFGPVVEDNYQPAQPEDADQPENTDRQEGTDRQEDADQQEDADRQKDTDRQEGADQPESAEKPKGADQHESAEQQPQPQQAAPAPAPAAPTPKNDKGNGVFSNIITVINNAATALKLTLKDVKIDVSRTGSPVNDDDKGRAALSVQGKGDVEIELDGDNELKSGAHRAGLEKTSTATGTLTLKDDNKEAGSLTATGNYNGAGIGGGARGSGSNVTVSGAAQVTATVSKSNRYYGAGATIGNGGNQTPDGELVDGEEIQAKIDDLFPGYIHHIIYDPDLKSEDNPDGIVREWWEPVRPDGESRLDLLHVETLEGDPLPFNAQQQGGTLRVTTDNLSARLHGTRQALEALREQGAEQIQFVTTLKTTTLSVEDLLAEGGSWFALEHDGLVSRQLSTAQAESLKCWMH